MAEGALESAGRVSGVLHCARWRTILKRSSRAEERLPSGSSVSSSAFRRGASAAALDGVRVESYGAKVPLQQVASVTGEDARTLRITPYNRDDIVAIEKALTDADLGLGVGSDDRGVRVTFPELTTETRERYTKLVHKKLEEARVSLRSIRDEAWGDIQERERDGAIGKDEKFRFKDKMEELVKKANGELESLAERKEKDIRG